MAIAERACKELIANETVWGARNDATHVEVMRYTLAQLTQRGIGFTVHALHHSLVADLHRDEWGPVGRPEWLHFIEADGSLRPGHEAFNEFGPRRPSRPVKARAGRGPWPVSASAQPGEAPPRPSVQQRLPSANGTPAAVPLQCSTRSEMIDLRVVGWRCWANRPDPRAVTTTIPDDLWSELLRPLRNPALAELKPVRRVWSAQVRRGERED